MTPERWQRIAPILDEVLECPAAERQEMLARLCGDDAMLCADIERLVDADGSTMAILDDPLNLADELASEVGSGSSAVDTLEADSRIGAYRLVRRIGQGGMGAVFLAERADGAFEQTVALKVVLAGPVSEEDGLRFLQERQILAELDHPNIARLLDGGVADDGRPYFVMEYVEGLPVTTYCASHRLGVDDRLRLFLAVCEAVDLAHRHLVVHRDLKPSNILVDDDGRPRLLDFGIAKLLAPGRARTPQTIAVALTPEYAAPEQVRGRPITVATDVYGLGVVLYELLTGRLPYVAESLLEVPAVILQQEPLRPSVAVRSGDPRTTSALASSPSRLRRVLRGDLDTILLKALHKEPERRYQSAAALRGDIERYLDHRPILARPDSWPYRARRFVRRHAVASAAALVVSVSLVAGAIATSWQARVASRQARRSTAVQAFMASVFRVIDPGEFVGRTVTAREILDLGAKRVDTELSGTPELQADVLTLIGRLYIQLGLYKEASPLLVRALALRRELNASDRSEISDSLDAIGLLQIRLGEYAAAERTLSEAEAILGRAPTNLDQRATTLNHLGEVQTLNAELRSAETSLLEAIEIRRTRTGGRDPAMAESLLLLARVRRADGDVEKAAALDREATELLRASLGANRPDMLQSMASVAMVALERGDYREAEDLYRQALAAAKRTVGPDHPDTLHLLSQLGIVASRSGKLGAGEVLLREALEAQQLRVGEAHPSLVSTMNALAWTLSRLDRQEEAERLYRDAFGIAKRRLGAEHPDLANVLTNLGRFLIDRGRPVEAEPLLKESVAILENIFGEGDTRTTDARLALADCRRALRGNSSGPFDRARD